MADQPEYRAYAALSAFLASTINGRQGEQKAQIILQELDRLSSDQLGRFVDLCEAWYAARR